MVTESKAPWIAEALAARFSAGHIVFWHDVDGEFADVLDGLDLGGDVQTIRLDAAPALAIKRHIEGNPTGRFLLYSNKAEPDPAFDWLLDIRLRSQPFRADLTSVRLTELGLSNAALAPHLRARSKFLAA